MSSYGRNPNGNGQRRLNLEEAQDKYNELQTKVMTSRSRKQFQVKLNKQVMPNQRMSITQYSQDHQKENKPWEKEAKCNPTAISINLKRLDEEKSQQSQFISSNSPPSFQLNLVEIRQEDVNNEQGPVPIMGNYRQVPSTFLNEPMEIEQPYLIRRQESQNSTGFNPLLNCAYCRGREREGPFTFCFSCSQAVIHHKCAFESGRVYRRPNGFLDWACNGCKETWGVGIN